MKKLELPTHVCRAGWDEHEFYGRLQFRDFAGKETMTGMLGLVVTGAPISPELRGFLDDIASVAGPPDPRIWPPKATRVASAYGHTIPAVAVGALIFDSYDVGPMTSKDAAAFFMALSEIVGDRLDNPQIVEQATFELLARRKRIAGFGTHFRPVDERLVALRKCIVRRGLHHGRYWRLFEGAGDALRKAKGIEPNLAGAMPAVMLDLGVAPATAGILAFAIYQHVQMANAIEGAEQAPEILRRLPDEYIAYVGAPPRTSPRAQEA